MNASVNRPKLLNIAYGSAFSLILANADAHSTSLRKIIK